MINNLNATTEPVKLSLTVNYDFDLSRHWFNENFKSLSYEGFSLLNDRYFKVNIFQFIDYGNDAELDLYDAENYKFTKADIDSYLHSIENHDGLLESSQYYFDKTYSKLNKEELLELIDNISHEGRSDFLLNLPENQRLYEVVSVRGYCQGDYAEIVISNKLIESFNFDDLEAWLDSMGEYFTNLFYSSPVYASLEYDDQELFFHEFMGDQYNYDEGELLSIADQQIEHDQKAYILEWLKENLPSEPSYTGV